MKEAVDVLRAQLAKLPADHSDRAGIEAMVTLGEDWHQRKAAPKVDLRQQTYDLLHLVRQPTEQEKEVLGRRGIVFLPLETKSYAQVVEEDPEPSGKTVVNERLVLDLLGHFRRLKVEESHKREDDEAFARTRAEPE